MSNDGMSGLFGKKCYDITDNDNLDPDDPKRVKREKKKKKNLKQKTSGRPTGFAAVFYGLQPVGQPPVPANINANADDDNGSQSTVSSSESPNAQTDRSLIEE
jgi:hypothetical protein